MAGFTMVEDALITAATAVRDVVSIVDTDALSSLGLSEARAGNAEVASALESFTDRWTVGLGKLVGGGENLAEALRAVASSYVGVDLEVAERLQSLEPQS
jgi:hypothetical protein